MLLDNLGYIAAGDSGKKKVDSGQCMQIATGAPLPKGSDSVVMKEDIEIEDSKIRFTRSIQGKENVRYQGEDIMEGDTIITAGTVIGPAQIATLATFGFSQVPVYRVPKVSIVSTGSELIDVVDQPLSLIHI